LFPELRRGRDKTYRRYELMTLTYDLWLMRVVVLHPQTKFEVRIGLAIQKIGARCVSALMGLATL